MPRALKTYVTTAGFFDLAVAAPSMKAALEAWGSGSNLFHQGFAKVSTDAAIVKATMAKPGRVLKRPVGTDRKFSEDSSLPGDFLAKGDERARMPASKVLRRSTAPIEGKAARQAAAQFDREQTRRRHEEQRQEAAREKQRVKREKAIAKAEAALEKATTAHADKEADLRKAQRELDHQVHAEEARWEREVARLKAELHRARAATHLRLV